MPRSDVPFDTPTIPGVITDATPSDVLAVITRAVFQTGVSWAQIARSWNAYRHAFEEFDPAIVARYDDVDIERILATPGILRQARKVRASIANAAALAAIVAEYGSFAQFIATLPGYAAQAKALKKRFAFLGDMNAWYVLFRLHLPVPRFETWVTSIPGDHPRMREMVDLARAHGVSIEAADSATRPDEPAVADG